MDEGRNTMEVFDQKVARVFREELPEMPELPDLEELDQETLEQLQAAGDGILADHDIALKVRDLLTEQSSVGALGGGAK